MFDQYLKDHKEIIRNWLSNYLHSLTSTSINSWGIDLITRLQSFSTTGKMVRGTLVYLGYELSNQLAHSDLLPIASALELIHTGLLIHDDIMDHDQVRRGHMSLHTQYEELFIKHHVKSPKDLGTSFAICAGDQTFFYAYAILSKHTSIDVQQIISQYMQYVIEAQMQDVYNGSTNKLPKSDQDILQLYRYKTGEYSITLPLIVGAMIGNAPNETIQHLKLFGKHIGIAYQLVDDLLNIFGDTTVTGKPVGSDFIEQKKTLYWYYLQQTTKGKEVLQPFIESHTVSNDHIKAIQTYLIESKIDAKIHTLIESYATEAKDAIIHIPMHETAKRILLNSIEYFTNRNS